MTARARNGRFTAERTTETTRTERITERITVEVADTLTALPGDPVPVFTRLFSSPPDGAQWAHPAFLAYLAARPSPAVLPRAETLTVPAPPVPVITVPRTYPELAEDTLAHEFTGADRERLELTLDASGYLT